MKRSRPVKNDTTRESVIELRMESDRRPGKARRHISCADGLSRWRSQA